ncbi:hypothetical protein EDD38_0494 [Kitasatospora cineracea]|uniref:Uncharacterized protein n=1 Tax=Kitasatospora cineracea TaxID=88074 RepID=A0A3N4RV59_9ACTN|nr:hypothetical protein EDD38_0494 [Kitasatospora cineracea]
MTNGSTTAASTIPSTPPSSTANPTTTDCSNRSTPANCRRRTPSARSTANSRRLDRADPTACTVNPATANTGDNTSDSTSALRRPLRNGSSASAAAAARTLSTRPSRGSAATARSARTAPSFDTAANSHASSATGPSPSTARAADSARTSTSACGSSRPAPPGRSASSPTIRNPNRSSSPDITRTSWPTPYPVSRRNAAFTTAGTTPPRPAAFCAPPGGNSANDTVSAPELSTNDSAPGPSGTPIPGSTPRTTADNNPPAGCDTSHTPAPGTFDA